MRKRYEELNYLDKGHIDFYMNYLKSVLSFRDNPNNLHDIGKILEVEGEYGVVVGYCGLGYEYALFEDSRRDTPYVVVGIEGKKNSTAGKMHFEKAKRLLELSNDYLIKNCFKLSTSYQKECYEHWIKTGEYLFLGNKKEIEDSEIEKKIEQIQKELEELKNMLK